jgi:hypothetical protein
VNAKGQLELKIGRGFDHPATSGRKCPEIYEPAHVGDGDGCTGAQFQTPPHLATDFTLARTHVTLDPKVGILPK